MHVILINVFSDITRLLETASQVVVKMFCEWNAQTEISVMPSLSFV
jgi:hypothetical protein